MSQGPPPQPVSVATPTFSADAHWPAAALWAGGIACLAGILGHGLLADWVPAPRRAALAGARREAAVEGIEWWRLPPPDARAPGDIAP